MGLSKKDEAQIWDTMMAQRRRLGPDPEDHPSVKRRMEYDYVTILLVIKWLLAKISMHPDGTYQVTSGRRLNASSIVQSLILVLLIATTIFSWLAYRELTDIKERRSIVRSQWEYLGKALSENPKFTITREGTDFVIKVERNLEEAKGDTIRVPHKIPPVELKRLQQE